MRTIRLLPVALGALALVGCDFFGAGGPEVCEPAQAMLQSGDLPGAEAEYAALAQSSPDNPCVATGRAYVLTLKGDYSGADQLLSAAEATAGEQVGDVKLRRALVALRGGDLDAVKTHGKASGTPAGKVLAAEVHLADAETDEAIALLKEAAGAGGAAGDTAKQYLAMLEGDDQLKVGLAEVTALWALGARTDAVENAAELLVNLPDEDGRKNERLLVWAGRAVTSGNPNVARTLLDAMDFPPEGQEWRKFATEAMIAIAEEDYDRGVEILQALATGGAPSDGLADALATAACLSKDKAIAKQLAGNVESAAAGRCLLEAGAPAAAKKAAPPGSLRQYLENQ